jgi:hypothetical protein
MVSAHVLTSGGGNIGDPPDRGLIPLLQMTFFLDRKTAFALRKA